MTKRDDQGKHVRERQAQRIARQESNSAGTRGRPEHKGKARMSNKGSGGKSAR